MAITKIITPDLIDLPFNNTDGIVLAKGTTIAVASVQYLVVAGGGGGGGGTPNSWGGGGGGAGGLLTTTAEFAISTALPLAIGGGGVGASSRTVAGTNGNDSTFATITTTGGGGGGGESVNAFNGGSGGGSGGNRTGTVRTPGTGISGQGKNGGVDSSALNGSGSGGGGVTSDGVAAPSNILGGNGGDGVSSSITGGALSYAGGGGGASDYTGSGTGGSGGSGVGGNGGTDGVNSGNGYSGTLNTGGGGGGGNANPSAGATGGTGGSGVIILRTPSNTTAVFSGGVTANGSTGGSIAPDTSTGDNVWIVTATTNSTQTVTFSATGDGTGRPTTNLSDGEFRYNTTTKKVEFYDGADWFALTSSPALPQAGTTGTCNYPTTATALYQLNSGVGSNVPDTCGTYDGTATSITYSAGNFGNAANFNGSSSGIVLPSSLNTNVIDATGAFSISMWINTNSLSAIQYLFCASVSNNIDVSINGNNQGVGKIIWTIYNGSYSYLTSTTTITTNDWYHIVATYNNGSRELFINSASQGTSTKTLVESGQVSTLGYRTGSGSSERFDGGMDQLRIFPSALTQEQVSALYTETTP